MTGNLSSASALALTPNTFNFESHSVRVVMRDDEPWFVATDICDALNIQNASQVIARLDQDERSMFNIGRQGAAHIVNESGMYTLVLRCRDAINPGTVPHRFRKWVTSIVLPAIRKTGQFTAQPHNRASTPRPAQPSHPKSSPVSTPPTSSARCNCSTNTSTRRTATPACSSSCSTTTPKSPSSSPPAAIGTSAPAP